MVTRTGPTWPPSFPDYQTVYQEQNPWTRTGEAPQALARPQERPLAQGLWRRLLANNPPRFQLVLGPRRVGKTTVLYQTVRHLLAEGVHPSRVWWLRLDHPLLMQVPLGNLVRDVMQFANAMAAHPAYVFLDELTYAANWDTWLKTFYDERWPVQIVGSSSSTAALRNRRLESGVGRWEEHYLSPYLFDEFLGLTPNPAWAVSAQATLAQTLEALLPVHRDLAPLVPLRNRFMFAGGFPQLLIYSGSATPDPHTPSLFPESPDALGSNVNQLLESQRILRTDAVESAIYKDIPQAFGVEKPQLLERILYALAGQMTGVLAPRKVCQYLTGVSGATFDRYLGYLQRAFLVFTLSNFSSAEIAKQKRGRKLYFVDGAVRNATLQRGILALYDTSEMGTLIENLAAAHLHVLSLQTGFPLYYWRTSEGGGEKEVDLVFDDPAGPLAFEITASAKHSRTGLHELARQHPQFAAGRYIVSPQMMALTPRQSPDGVGTIPLDLFLLAVGAQAQRAMSLALGIAIDRGQPS